MTGLAVREYGDGPNVVIALHGGPAAAGDVAPLAEALGRYWHVLEPLQRGSGGAALTVATHVQDLDDVVRARCGEGAPVLVGHSWGAMLALAYTASRPGSVAGLALVGCGTFSESSRAEFERRLEARMSAADRAELARLTDSEPDANRRLAMIGRLMTLVYGHDLQEVPVNAGTLDAEAHAQTWSDMLAWQRQGRYPAAFASIAVPAVMLHGSEDPHPGALIAGELRAHLPQLEYQELPRCGHSPWLERQAAESFLRALNAWISATFRYELVSPSDSESRRAYHDIRRRVLWDDRGLVDVYQENHPDERAPGNHPKLLLHRGDPVGVVRIDCRGARASVRRVAIRSDLQRHGHGRILLLLVERFAREHGCARLESYVAPDAVAFYRKVGFSIEIDETVGASGRRSVFMTKPLSGV